MPVPPFVVDTGVVRATVAFVVPVIDMPVPAVRNDTICPLPSVPALSYKRLFGVPLATSVVPTWIELAAPGHDTVIMRLDESSPRPLVQDAEPSPDSTGTPGSAVALAINFGMFGYNVPVEKLSAFLGAFPAYCAAAKSNRPAWLRLFTGMDIPGLT